MGEEGDKLITIKDFERFPSQVVEDNIFSTSLARENWESKYRYGDETPLETFKRVAKAVASVEENPDYWYGRFLDMMLKTEPTGEGTYRAVGLKNTFGGRITANAGTRFDGATLLNCYINLPPQGATITYDRWLEDGSFIPVKYEGEDMPDNMVNIMVALMEAAMTLKSEGGYGINFGFIRPRGSLIEGVGIEHPGVVAYMEMWDKVSDVIVRGNSDGYEDTLENKGYYPEDESKLPTKAQARKGAMMGVLPVWHPDIEEFVRAKQEPGRLTKFNISVLMNDKFMKAVKDGRPYTLWFPRPVSALAGSRYYPENPPLLSEVDPEWHDTARDSKGNLYDVVDYKTVDAGELYDLIMRATYNRAEPGVLFYDNMQSNNPLSYINVVDATNPCGEVPGFLTVCLLGNVNLTQYVNDDRTFDWQTYKKDVATFTRAMDNVNDLNNNPLPQYDWAMKNVRQIGMGINGLGSALLMMGIPFNSVEAQEFTADVTEQKELITWRTSANLADGKGSFPGYTEEFLETKWFRRFEQNYPGTADAIRTFGVRNGKTTTNAPNGNTSIICDVTSNGIEPVFMYEYDRTYIAPNWPAGLTKENVRGILSPVEVGDSTAWEGEYAGRTYYYEPHNRGLCIKEKVKDYGYAWLEEHYPEEVEKYKAGESDYFVTTETLTVTDHLNILDIVQQHNNQGTSKTINIPNDYDFEDFKDLYMEGWGRGIIGLTTYRAGTMEEVMGASTAPAEANLDNVLTDGVKLPDVFVNGDTQTIKRENGKFYVHLSYHPDDTTNPVAIWVTSNQATPLRQVNAAVSEVIQLIERAGVARHLIDDTRHKIAEDTDNNRLGRAISMALRHNIPPLYIVDALNKVPEVYVSDLLFAVRKVLSALVPDGTGIGSECGNCGERSMIFESGCTKCLNCGASNCA